ncbi:hypothetical protein DID74_00875 [Candidatus Marinamargulisbacteria bacterium SCGC AG-333-B06]|nr:hypothetical protein DID74_00875 [Candidatus Marinamargulisbacteria bacterium SCGC AG-333-B06]
MTISPLESKIPIASKVKLTIATPVPQQADDISIPMPPLAQIDRPSISLETIQYYNEESIQLIKNIAKIFMMGVAVWGAVTFYSNKCN